MHTHSMVSVKRNKKNSDSGFFQGKKKQRKRKEKKQKKRVKRKIKRDIATAISNSAQVRA